MKGAQKPDHISLQGLVTRLKEGRYVIPDFQREFEWRPWDIKDLMRSIFLDYYIGSLLLWKGKTATYEALSCEVIYGFNGTTDQHPWNSNGGSPEYVVLDGQQRLTALYYAFISPNVPLPNRANRAVYYIQIDKFMEEMYDEAFHYDWMSKRVQALLDDRDSQYRSHFFPLLMIGSDGWELFDWLKGYEQYWKEKASSDGSEGGSKETEEAKHHAENAKQFSEHLKGITTEYQISYIELDKDIAVDKVCDIFTQINSRGIRLDVFDLINALLKPKGLQLKHMWREAAPRLDFVDNGKMNVYILQVMSILTQAYCSPKYLYYLLPGQEKQVKGTDGSLRKEILMTGAPEFQHGWDKAVLALENAIRLLKHPQEFGAISPRYLPYASILPVFASLQSEVGHLPPDHQLDAQRKIRHWYWTSVFTNRYSGAVESTSARDFLDVKGWLTDADSVPAMINDFKANFKSLELRKETKKGSSVYNGIFNLLVIQGARDWMKGSVPQHDDLDDHHIVPAWWGKKNLGDPIINSILNRTPLTADTNRKVINDRLPNEYLPQMIKNSGETRVQEILDSHFITPHARDILLRPSFTASDFVEFITERQLTIQRAIERLLIKARLDLSPELSELNTRIENIELTLRQKIFNVFQGDITRVPVHVQRKATERVERAAKKNPALDVTPYKVLPGLLEYCDLRELQDTFVSKSSWPEFSPLFTNKETLISKLDKLADLRNAIRHSRSADQITQKEGEAAILWFEKVLRK